MLICKQSQAKSDHSLLATTISFFCVGQPKGYVAQFIDNRSK